MMLEDLMRELTEAAKNTPYEPIAERVLPDGRWVTLDPMTFGKVRINVAPYPGAMVIDDSYCYDDAALGLQAFWAWDPTKDAEPSGWFRHPQSGRRRPDGDPAKEYIHP